MQIKQLVDMLDASNAELNALTNQTSTERQLFEQETGQLTMEVASLRRQLSGHAEERQRDLETHSKSFREQQASWEVVLCVCTELRCCLWLTTFVKFGVL